MKINSSLISCIIYFLLVGQVVASDHSETKVNFFIVNDETAWLKVKKQAQETDKTIFVDVYTDWCGYCKMMDKEVFNDQFVGNYLNEKFVSVKLDAETKFGEKFSADNGVSGFPTYVFFDGSSSKIGEISGYHKKDDFLGKIKDLEQKVQKLPTLEQKLVNGTLSKDEKAEYAVLLKDTDVEKSKKLADELLPSLSKADFLNPKLTDFLTIFSSDIKSEFFKFIAKNKNTFSEKVGKGKLDVYLGGLYNAMLSEAIISKNKAKVEEVINKVLPLYIENDAELPQASYVTWKLYYANNNDIESYIATVKDEYENIGKDNEDFWYEQAYEIIEEYSSMVGFVDVACQWIEKSLEIREDYETYALYAYALGIKGDFNMAMEKTKEAKKLAKNNEQIEMANELIKMIDDARSAN